MIIFGGFYVVSSNSVFSSNVIVVDICFSWILFCI